MSFGSRLGSHLLKLAGWLGLAPEQAGLLLLPQSVTVALDVDGHGVVQQAVEDRRGQDLVVEDLPPVDEALVARHDQARPLVAEDQQPEEETGLLAGERKVRELIEDQDPRVAELLQDPLEPVLVAGADDSIPQPSYARLAYALAAEVRMRRMALAVVLGSRSQLHAAQENSLGELTPDLRNARCELLRSE